MGVCACVCMMPCNRLESHPGSILILQCSWDRLHGSITVAAKTRRKHILKLNEEYMYGGKTALNSKSLHTGCEEHKMSKSLFYYLFLITLLVYTS